MAGKKKATKAKSASSASNVTRVRATDDASAPKKKKADKPAKAKAVVTPIATATSSATTPTKKPKRTVKPGVVLKPVKATGGYFKGAWVELKQVRWPNRRATWSMTGAVLLYSAFFVVLVLLLDAGFKYLFELILGK